MSSPTTEVFYKTDNIPAGFIALRPDCDYTLYARMSAIEAVGYQANDRFPVRVKMTYGSEVQAKGTVQQVEAFLKLLAVHGDTVQLGNPVEPVVVPAPYWNPAPLAFWMEHRIYTNDERTAILLVKSKQEAIDLLLRRNNPSAAKQVEAGWFDVTRLLDYQAIRSILVDLEKKYGFDRSQLPDDETWWKKSPQDWAITFDAKGLKGMASGIRTESQYVKKF